MEINNTGEPTVLHYTFGKIRGYKEVSKMLPSLRKFNQSEVAKERRRIIDYYQRYGGQATLDAFGVDRKLIYVWKQRLSNRVAFAWSNGGGSSGPLNGTIHSIRDGSLIVIETGYEYCLEVVEGGYTEGPNFGHFLNSACTTLEAMPTPTLTNTPTATATPTKMIFLPLIQR